MVMVGVLPRTKGCLTFINVPTTAKSDTQRSPLQPVLNVTSLETVFESRGSNATQVSQNSWLCSGILVVVSYLSSIWIGLKISAKVPRTWTVKSMQLSSRDISTVYCWIFWISLGENEARLYFMSNVTVIIKSERNSKFKFFFNRLSWSRTH